MPLQSTNYYPGLDGLRGLVAGVLTAVIARENAGLLDTRRLRPNALTAISFIVLIVVVALISRSNPTHGSIWTLEWLFAALFFVMFISLIQSTGISSKILSSRFCVSIGRASYSLYLTHIIAIYIVIKRVSPEQHGILSAAIVLLLLTSVYYVIVERPFVIMSKRISVK